MDVDDSGPGGRSPSVASEVRPGTHRRGVRGPYKKTTTTTTSTTISESIDAEGRLPGSRDGLAAFPPGSDWAQTMVALKLKGTFNRWCFKYCVISKPVLFQVNDIERRGRECELRKKGPRFSLMAA